MLTSNTPRSPDCRADFTFSRENCAQRRTRSRYGMYRSDRMTILIFENCCCSISSSTVDGPRQGNVVDGGVPVAREYSWNELTRSHTRTYCHTVEHRGCGRTAVRASDARWQHRLGRSADLSATELLIKSPLSFGYSSTLPVKTVRTAYSMQRSLTRIP